MATAGAGPGAGSNDADAATATSAPAGGEHAKLYDNPHFRSILLRSKPESESEPGGPRPRRPFGLSVIDFSGGASVDTSTSTSTSTTTEALASQSGKKLMAGVKISLAGTKTNLNQGRDRGALGPAAGAALPSPGGIDYRDWRRTQDPGFR